MKAKTKKTLAFLLIAIQLFVTQSLGSSVALAADTLPVRAYATDTVAGYATSLRTSLVKAGQQVIFVVEKPDKSVVRVPTVADLDGVAQADLYGHQTKVSGQYKVAVLFAGSPVSSPQTTFKVYPDQLSLTQSTLTVTRAMVSADGEDKTFITVTLNDQYRNPIKNHQTKLISSRQDDQVTPLSNGVTDEAGRANFKVTSKYDGVSVFTAMDITLNQVLAQREEVVFFKDEVEPASIGGNFFSTNLLGAQVIQNEESNALPGPVDRFEIQDLPANIKLDTDQTLTVIARDKNGNIAKNYTGTILFSTPDDENAILPGNGEYTFKEADQGKFTFNLALRFSKLGNQTLQIFDKDNWRVSGEKAVSVVPQQSVFTPDVSGNLTIKSPVDGGEFGSSLIVITGKGEPNVNLKIFDDDVKIGDSETDSDGFFTFEASGLTNGAHTFYVTSSQEDISPSVSIHIDTTPPVLNQIYIQPDGIVSPGKALNISLQSEPGLDSVKVRLQGVEEPLLPAGDPGTYEATVAAPTIAGNYPVDVILLDRLANKAELLNQRTIQVQESPKILPPSVEGFDGTSGDGEVTLMWDEITTHTETIEKYRILYGEAFDDLNKTVETEGKTGTFTVKELENGKQYFFAIRAVDIKGSQSENQSITLALTPEPLTPLPTEEEEGMEGDMIGSDTFVQGTPSSNAVMLSWQPFPGVQAYYYKVVFGLRSGHYDDYEITKDNRTTIEIRDLINDIPYYFAVVALNINKQEISPLSTEFSVTPTGSGFHAAPVSNGVLGSQQGTYPSFPYNPPLSNEQLGKIPANEKTGTEAFWLIAFSLFAAHFFYVQAKRILRIK